MTEEPKIRTWLAPQELAAKYGISPNTVYSWIKTKKLQAVRRDKRNLVVVDPGFLDVPVRSFKEFPLIRGVEVARKLGISPRRLRQLAEAGTIGFRKIGAFRRYSVQDVRNYMAYRKSREGLPNGANNKKPLSAKKKRELLIKWMDEELADSP